MRRRAISFRIERRSFGGPEGARGQGRTGQGRFDTLKKLLLMAILLAIIIVPVGGMALMDYQGSSVPSQSSAIDPEPAPPVQGDAFRAPKPLTTILLGTILVGLAGWGRKKFRR